MRLASLTLLLGILSCHLLLERVIQLPIALLLLALPLLWIISFFRYRFQLFWLIFGFLWMLWHSTAILTQRLPVVIENKPVILIGTIVGFPRNTAKYRQCVLAVSQLKIAGIIQPFQARVRIRWNLPKNLPAGFPRFTPQQTWQLTARLHPVHEVLNFDVPDYSNILFQQRIRAIGQVERTTRPLLLATASRLSIDLWRYKIMLKINKLLPDNPLRGMIIALTLGEGRGIEQAHWQLFRNTGIIHLVVISGSHISLIALLIFGIMSGIWRYTGRLTLWLPAPQAAAIVSLLAAIGYTLLAGASIPTQRAIIMVTVVIINKLLARQTPSFDLIAIALFLVLLYDPLAVLSNGFWLSFSAVAAIIWVLHGRRTSSSRAYQLFHDTLMTQWSVFAVLFPILLLYYGTFPLNSFIANLVVIPWFNIVIVPLSLLGLGLIAIAPELATACLEFSTVILHGCLSFLNSLSQFNWLVQTTAPPTGLSIAIAGVGIGFLLLPRGFPARWLGGILLLPILFSPTMQPRPGEVWFTLFDIGQGLAAIVQTQNHTLIYDTGDKRGDTTMADRVIIPYLRARQIHQVEMLMVSHSDADHASGVATLQQNIKIIQTLSSDLQRIPHSNLCQAGQHWTWDTVEFRVLHPDKIDDYSSSNNRSCVLKIQTGKHGILLAGDIEGVVENQLSRHYPYILQAEIMVVPHHGSKTSSSPSLLQVVKPQFALISSGYRNRFRHPRPEIVARYQSIGTTVLNTAETGAIAFTLSEQHISPPRLARVEMHRYWHD
jgi:competence protein ComEC